MTCMDVDSHDRVAVIVFFAPEGGVPPSGVFFQQTH